MTKLDLLDQILTCTACDLHQLCSAPVPWSGDPCRIAIVGEAPGQVEDDEGRPFVGPAGQLLRSLLAEAGITEPVAYLNTASCLGGNTRVFLADGTTERIEKLVKDRFAGEVLSADSTGEIVARRVTDWHRNPIAGRSMFRVTHEMARSNMHGPVGFDATGDHEVLTDRGWRRVDELRDGDHIHTGMADLDEVAEQVILSGLLGDATLDKRTLTQMEFCSGADEQGYISAKRDLLRGIVSATSRGRGWPSLSACEPSRSSAGWRFRVTHPGIKRYSQVPLSIQVGMLDDFGLALWYMDDGHLRVRPGRQPDAQISIARFPLDQAEAAAVALRWRGIPCEMRVSSMGPRLMFGVEGTKVLLSRIGKYIHPDHARKRLTQGKWEWPQAGYEPLFAPVRTIPIAAPSTVYCLSVEEHQNFVTVGGVVHNCYPRGTPTWDQVDACQHNKLDQLNYLNPTYVLLLGRIALRAMRGDLDLRHGRSRPFRAHGYLCFGTYHPSAALRNRTYESALRADLDRFVTLLSVGEDHWTDRIPASCAGCAVDAEWFEADTGLGWCRIHLPSSQVPAYQARQDQINHDLAQARAAAATKRDEGLTRVETAADRAWIDRAWDALTAYLRTHEEFFVDDFWAETALPRPAEARALGPVVQRAAREGLMERSGNFRKSVASNLTEKPVWTSKIYRLHERLTPTPNPTPPPAPGSGVQLAREAVRTAIDELTETIATDDDDSESERRHRRQHLDLLRQLNADEP